MRVGVDDNAPFSETRQFGASMLISISRNSHSGVFGKTRQVTKKWVLIDAKGLVVGRLATLVAMRLRGKPPPDPHAPRRLRRQRRHHQRGACRADRSQARQQGLLQTHRLHRWHQERTAKSILEGRLPSAWSEGHRAMIRAVCSAACRWAICAFTPARTSA